MFNMSFGFLGIQFGWGLQLANMSAVYERLGAKPDAAGFELWPRAGAPASIAPKAAIVIIRIGMSLPKSTGVSSCVPIKLLVQLLQRRNKQDWTRGRL